MRLPRRFAPRNDRRRKSPYNDGKNEVFVIARHVGNMSWQSHPIIPTVFIILLKMVIDYRIDQSIWDS